MAGVLVERGAGAGRRSREDGGTGRGDVPTPEAQALASGRRPGEGPGPDAPSRAGGKQPCPRLDLALPAPPVGGTW